MTFLTRFLARTRSTPVRSMPGSRLRVEQLEDRSVPATFTVSNLNDSGAGSLRAAIDSANSSVGADTIEFSTSGIIVLGTTLPTFTETGAANTTTINGGSIGISGNNGGFRGMVVNSNVFVVLNQIGLFNCQTTSAGAGIFSTGNLTITNSILRDNVSTDLGGGIRNAGGTLTIVNCTFSGNSAGAGNAGAAIDSSGSLSITNSTISGNTFTGVNSARGAIWQSGTFIMNNTIVANTTGTNASDIRLSSGTMSGTNNIITSINSAGTNALVNTITTNPNLAPLAHYGGPNQTFALNPGSVAINAGHIAYAPVFDQRGFLRNNGPVDIGAYEKIDTFLVDDLSDVSNFQIGPGKLTLREAVGIAQSDPGSNSIEFAQPGTIFLKSPLVFGGVGASNATTINGLSWGGVIINGNNAVQLMTVQSNAFVNLNNLTLVNGKNTGNGGAIDNGGNLTVSNCTFLGNSSVSGRGGAISHTGASLAVLNSTFSGNSAPTRGAAISIFGANTTINNSTFSGNILTTPDFARGAVWFDESATMSNSIVANTTNGSDVVVADTGTILSGTTNVITTLATTAGGTNSLTGTLTSDPLLASLDYYGGPTQTFALRAGSPAIAAANTSTATLSDQRGISRGATPDIGAFQTRPSTLYILNLLGSGGGPGLWNWRSSGFTNMNPNFADSIVEGSDGSLYIDFGVTGLWRWTSRTGFTLLSQANPNSMLAGTDGYIYINFGTYGLWRYSPTTNFEHLNTLAPEAMVQGKDGVLYLDFGIYGLWRWAKSIPTTGNFEQLNAANPDQIVISNDNFLYVDFGIYGLWCWSKSIPGSNYELLTTADSENMILGPDSVLYIDFGIYGLWRWSDAISSPTTGNFELLTTANADTMIVGTDNVLYVDFGIYGLWRWSKSIPTPGNFEQISTGDVELMSMSSDGFLYCDFGIYGLWRWSKTLTPSNFVQLSPANPTGLLPRS